MATLMFRYRPRTRREQAVDAVTAQMADEAERDDRVADPMRDRWWYESSYDLRSGLEVDDSIGQTIPGDVLDAMFKR